MTIGQRICSLLCLGAIATGCASKSEATRATRAVEPTSSPPAADVAAGPSGAAEKKSALQRPATLEELQVQLDELDADLAAQGVDEDGATTPAGTPQPADDENASRCERICELQAAICDVADRICSLAEEHAGEEKYDDACTRAGDRCEQATEACSGCEGG